MEPDKFKTFIQSVVRANSKRTDAYLFFVALFVSYRDNDWNMDEMELHGDRLEGYKMGKELRDKL